MKSREISIAPHRSVKIPSGWFFACFLLCVLTVTSASAQQVTFEDIAPIEAAGLAYDRGPSLSEGAFAPFIDQGWISLFDTPFTPLKSRGAPGTAIFDADGDGDQDIYVTNGPGRDNSLFMNQLRETGQIFFEDRAVPSGVAALSHDSSGVCFGDTDNDGDHDLLVLGNFGENLFFVNRGDGTFTDVTAVSGFGGVVRSSLSCSFGDVNGDGLLDVVVANCCEDMSNQFHTGGVDPFAFNQANQLYVNRGGNTFEDVSESSGILELAGLPPGVSTTITWAIGLVDYDHDGDVDLIQADDQANVPYASDGGIDRGFLQLFRNDGTGHFTNVSEEAGTLAAGSGWWMGLSFGDVNGDGRLDVFGTNFGDYGITLITPLDPVYGNFFNYDLGRGTSRWLLGQADDTFTDPGVGDLVANPFGWGTSMVDYDNDGDTDIIYHGGLNPGTIVQTAPGVMLRNTGAGEFEKDDVALAGSTNHELRTVQGMSVGDLDDDGFADIVSVSNFDIPADAPLATYNVDWGSPYDFGRYHQWFTPSTTPGILDFGGVQLENGTLAVELSSADNRNRWVKVRLRGTADLGGRSNRDGIGAVVTFTTWRGKTTARPVMGGASYASQDSLELGFGLGRERLGTVDVLWPGGTKNRLYGAYRGERLVLPEIPCSYDGDFSSPFAYFGCVVQSLNRLLEAEEIERRFAKRLLRSSLRAYFEENF